MKTYKLIKEKITEEYPVKHIGEFDPFLEYFVFDEENVYILRAIGKEIILINLFSFVTRELSKNEFENLPGFGEVFILPHYTGGCCDYTPEHKEIENKERAKMFQKIANIAKSKCK